MLHCLKSVQLQTWLTQVATGVNHTVDISLAVRSLSAEGHRIDREALKTLSPYITRLLKRYGDFVIELQNIPQPLEEAISLLIEMAES